MIFLAFRIEYIIMLTLVTGIIYYLTKRNKLFFPAIPQKTFILGFIAIFVFIVLNSTILLLFEHVVFRVIGVFGLLVTSFGIFLLMSLAFIDLLNLFFKFKPKIRGLYTFVLALLLTVYGTWNALSVSVKEVTIPMKGLTHEIRAVHISDIHLGNFYGKRQVNKIVDKIKPLNPDVIFNTGDLFDTKTHFGEGKDVLSAFRSLNVPHYFVNGNHDQLVGEREVLNVLNSANATVLSNEIAIFGELQIIGLNNMQTDENSFDPLTKPGTETIKSVLANMIIDVTLPTILLHHRPDGLNYMQEKGVDLFLTGHFHGGHFFPLSLFSKLRFGSFGHYKYETMDVNVSEGTGIFFPIRFGTKNIITLIRLVPSDIY